MVNILTLTAWEVCLLCHLPKCGWVLSLSGTLGAEPSFSLPNLSKSSSLRITGSRKELFWIPDCKDHHQGVVIWGSGVGI